MRWNRSDVVGHVDHAGSGHIRGWAADLRATRSRLTLDVFRHGIYLGCARTGAFREDLRSQGIGDGCHGFVFHSAALAAADATDGLEVVAPDVRRSRLTIPGRPQAPSRSARPDGAAEDHTADARSFFRPMLEAIASGDDPAPMQASATSLALSARIDRLFAQRPEPMAASPSAFAAHIAAKYEMPAMAPERFWQWYLGAYGVEQAGRVPLSNEDIDHLARGGHFRGLERQYDWCIHESRRLKVEDCLVDDAAVQALVAAPWWSRLAAFPLSRFMWRLRRRHLMLRRCAVATKADRVAFYVVLMLLALRDPHYLRSMPAPWVDRVLAAESGGSLFERTQAGLFGDDVRRLSSDRYRAMVRSACFDLAARCFSTVLPNGHRLAAPPRPTKEADVQLIGPFHQSLGLAESCRRIAHALQNTGLDVAFVDYRVGTRPIMPHATIETGELREARINLLHLNAEEVPEAMVSLPTLLGDRHTIVIPYWELDKPSAVHRLGLDLVDEIWCTTHFLAHVFMGSKPVSHIGMSFDDSGAPSRPAPRRTDGFTVLCIADALSWLARKNVLGAVEAFQAAFPGDSTPRLIVKTRNAGAPAAATRGDEWRAVLARCRDDPRIRILDADLVPDEQKKLLAGADCLLSLHRAEGLGLDMLDALHLGTPVVATAYSGNMGFCGAETAWLVDYELTAVAPGQYAFVEPGHRWAEPNLGSAVAALRAVRDDPVARARKTQAARAFVEAHAAPARLAARLGDLLRARLAPIDQFVSGSILPR